MTLHNPPDALNGLAAATDQSDQSAKQSESIQKKSDQADQSTKRSSTTASAPDDRSDESESGDQAGYSLPLDQVFEILKNSRRRETLHYLNEHGGETTLGELAEHIAAIENDTTVKAISSTQRKRVYVGLYQCHLPKMNDTDVIEFDKNRGTIELGPNASQLDPYLDQPEKQGWHKLYLSVTLGAAGLFVIGQVGGAALGLTPVVVLVVLLTGITACGIVHAWATE